MRVVGGRWSALQPTAKILTRRPPWARGSSFFFLYPPGYVLTRLPVTPFFCQHSIESRMAPTRSQNSSILNLVIPENCKRNLKWSKSQRTEGSLQSPMRPSWSKAISISLPTRSTSLSSPVLRPGATPSRQFGCSSHLIASRIHSTVCPWKGSAQSSPAAVE